VQFHDTFALSLAIPDIADVRASLESKSLAIIWRRRCVVRRRRSGDNGCHAVESKRRTDDCRVPGRVIVGMEGRTR
jgi:hypothetical protein